MTSERAQRWRAPQETTLRLGGGGGSRATRQPVRIGHTGSPERGNRGYRSGSENADFIQHNSSIY
jgi:hypothetical protein